MTVSKICFLSPKHIHPGSGFTFVFSTLLGYYCTAPKTLPGTEILMLNTNFGIYSHLQCAAGS